MKAHFTLQKMHERSISSTTATEALATKMMQEADYAAYAHILSIVSHEPVQRASPDGETPTHDTLFSCACSW